MRLITSLTVSAAAAWLAGSATAVVGLSAVRTRLPAMLTRSLSAEPDFRGALVLLGTGECAPEDGRAEQLRARLAVSSGRPVVYVDLTVAPGASSRQAVRSRDAARSFEADFVLDHDVVRGGPGTQEPAT